jgi:hypothetical protein
MKYKGRNIILIYLLSSWVLLLFIIPLLVLSFYAKSILPISVFGSFFFLGSIVGFILIGVTDYIEITEEEIKIKKIGAQLQIIDIKDVEIYRAISRNMKHGLSFHFNSYNIKIWKVEFNGSDWIEICLRLNERIGLKSTEYCFSE